MSASVGNNTTTHNKTHRMRKHKNNDTKLEKNNYGNFDDYIDDKRENDFRK